jgi:RimJ/RimL family protein N-acetyltransferase
MTEAVDRLISYGFSELKLDAIYAYTHMENFKALGLLKNFNFILVPELKDEMNHNNIVFKLVNKA